MFGFLKKKTDKEISKSVEQFNKLADTDIADIWKIDDKNNFVIAMNMWVCKKCSYGERIDLLSKYERIFYVAQQLEAEVNNGGFSQFFFNSSGDFSNELYDTFVEIGATKTASICKKATDAFGCLIPSDTSKREAFLDECLNEQVEAILAECDAAFYEYEDDLTNLNYHFIINNRVNFS